MEDRLIGRLGLTVGLKVCHRSETRLTNLVAEIVREFTGVKLPTVVKNYGTRNAKACDSVLPNELLYFSGGYGGYGLGLYPFGEVAYRYKKVLVLPYSLGERAEDIHSQCGEWQWTGDWHHGGGGDSLDGANFWHLSQVRTSVIASSCKLGQ